MITATPGMLFDELPRCSLPVIIPGVFSCLDHVVRILQQEGAAQHLLVEAVIDLKNMRVCGVPTALDHHDTVEAQVVG